MDVSIEVEHMVERIDELHREVHDHFKKAIFSYKEAKDKSRRIVNSEEGSLIMIHLRKARFPTGTYNKLKDRQLGFFKVLQKYGSNAYRIELSIELPTNLHINLVFHVVDLKSYFAPDDFQLAS